MILKKMLDLLELLRCLGNTNWVLIKINFFLSGIFIIKKYVCSCNFMNFCNAKNEKKIQTLSSSKNLQKMAWIAPKKRKTILKNAENNYVINSKP